MKEMVNIMTDKPEKAGDEADNVTSERDVQMMRRRLDELKAKTKQREEQKGGLQDKLKEL